MTNLHYVAVHICQDWIKSSQGFFRYPFIKYFLLIYSLWATFIMDPYTSNYNFFQNYLSGSYLKLYEGMILSAQRLIGHSPDVFSEYPSLVWDGHIHVWSQYHCLCKDMIGRDVNITACVNTYDGKDGKGPRSTPGSVNVNKCAPFSKHLIHWIREFVLVCSLYTTSNYLWRTYNQVHLGGVSNVGWFQRHYLKRCFYSANGVSGYEEVVAERWLDQ